MSRSTEGACAPLTLHGPPAPPNTEAEQIGDDRTESGRSCQFSQVRKDEHFKYPAQAASSLSSLDSKIVINTAAPVLPLSVLHRLHSSEQSKCKNTHLNIHSGLII